MISGTAAGSQRRVRVRPARILLYAFISLTAFVWLVPIAGAIFASFRPYAETVRDGFFSWPHSLTLDNYRNAWEQGDIPRKYLNTALILLPALVFTLFFSSMVAFVTSRYSWRFNILLLSSSRLVTCCRSKSSSSRYSSSTTTSSSRSSSRTQASSMGACWGLILIHVAFQSGFCTFVLSNYMKLLPKSLNDAARIDGAGVWKQYWQIIMPLTLPALAALATLEFTWIYNDFFWAVVLEQQGADRPITSSLANLGGQFFTDDNLIAAASMYVALPTLIVYLALQRYFIAGLTIGAEKG